MNQKVENSSRLNAHMASNSSSQQNKSVTFNLDNIHSSGYSEVSSNQVSNSISNSVYGENTNSSFSNGNQGLTPECIRVVSEAISGPILQEEAAKELAEQTTFRIRTLLQDAQKYMTHAKRKKLTREDLDLALRVEGQEPLYGTMAAEHLPFRFASGGGRELHFAEEKELDLNELVNGQNGGLPKIPLGPSLRAHWLAIDGVQPSIPENPPASDKDQLQNESTNPLSKLNKLDAIDNKLGVLLQNQKPGLAAARLKTTETVNVKQLAKHELSVEQQLYYKEITEACVGSDEPRRAEALQSLACDPGLHQMLPRLCTFIAEGVRVNVVQHNLAILIYLMRMVKSLLENQTLFLEKYLHELIPAVTTCIVARQLCARPDVDNHWALRDFASRLMSNICKNFNTSTNNVQTRMTRMYAEALRTDRSPLVSYYGAIAGLQELGPEVIKVFVLPHIKAISARIDAATEAVSVMGGATNMEKIAASHIKNLLLKGCTSIVKTLKQPPDVIEDYREEFGSIGQYLHAHVSRSRSSGPSANTTPTVPSATATPSAASMPAANTASIAKSAPTLVRLSSVSPGNLVTPTAAMAIATDQLPLSVTTQSMSTVMPSNTTPVSITNSSGIGTNNAQKIIVMSPSQAGQVQVVQQPPQAPHPPTPQWEAAVPAAVSDSNNQLRSNSMIPPSNVAAANLAASLASRANNQIFLNLPTGGKLQVVQQAPIFKIKEEPKTD